MKRTLFPTLLLLASCTRVLSVDDHRGGGGGGDAAQTGCDEDGDGHLATRCPTGDDCDDTDPNVFPGAPPICQSGVVEDCTLRAAPLAYPSELAGEELGLYPSTRARSYQVPRYGQATFSRARLSLVAVAAPSEVPRFYVAGIEGTVTSRSTFMFDVASDDPVDATEFPSWDMFGDTADATTIAFGSSGITASTLESIAFHESTSASTQLAAYHSSKTFVAGDDSLVRTAISDSTVSGAETGTYNANVVFAVDGSTTGWIHHRRYGSTNDDSLTRCTGTSPPCATIDLDGYVDTTSAADPVEVTSTGGKHVFVRVTDVDVASPALIVWNAFGGSTFGSLSRATLGLTDLSELGRRIGAGFVSSFAGSSTYRLAIPSSSGLVIANVACTDASACTGYTATATIRPGVDHDDADVTMLPGGRALVASLSYDNGDAQVFLDLIDTDGTLVVSTPMHVEAAAGIDVVGVEIAAIEGTSQTGAVRTFLVAVQVRRAANTIEEVWLSAVKSCAER